MVFVFLFLFTFMYMFMFVFVFFVVFCGFLWFFVFVLLSTYGRIRLKLLDRRGRMDERFRYRSPSKGPPLGWLKSTVQMSFLRLEDADF